MTVFGIFKRIFTYGFALLGAGVILSMCAGLFRPLPGPHYQQAVAMGAARQAALWADADFPALAVSDERGGVAVVDGLIRSGREEKQFRAVVTRLCHHDELRCFRAEITALRDAR